MKVITQETLYEEHGATLKHKCGKRIVALPLLFFSLIFLFFLSFWTFSLFLAFPFFDNVLLMMIITLLFIYLQLNDYNPILEQDMTLYEEHGATLKHNI